MSILPRYREFKDHLKSKSCSGLGLGSSPRAIETTEVTPFPSRCTIVDYVALGEGIDGRTLTIFSTQRSYGTFTDRSIVAFHSAASLLNEAPGNQEGMYRTKENIEDSTWPPNTSLSLTKWEDIDSPYFRPGGDLIRQYFCGFSGNLYQLIVR